MKDSLRAHLDGHVVVHLARVSELGDLSNRLEIFLDEREQARAARFRFAEDRARFVLGRGLLRSMAAHYLSKTPAQIEIGYGARNRPVFAHEPDVHFNIAHSGDHVAIALTAGGRVGVDVEFMRAELNSSDLAPRIFSQAGLAEFRTLPGGGEQRAAFFRAWTRKEAYLKARSEGIAEALQIVEVPLGEADIMSLRDARDAAVKNSWRLISLPVGPEHAGVVAIEGAEKPAEIFRVRHLGAGRIDLERA